MRRWIFAAVFLLVAMTGARAEPQWLALPPTPSLPKAEESGYAPVNGIKLWYESFGKGEPVILLHGGLANVNYWGKQVPVLARSYRVIVMDSRGHGRSSRWRGRAMNHVRGGTGEFHVDFLNFGSFQIQQFGIDPEARFGIHGNRRCHAVALFLACAAHVASLR